MRNSKIIIFILLLNFTGLAVAMGAARAQAEEECSICLDNKSADQMTRLHCGHRFCKSCVQISVSEVNIFAYRCLDNACRQGFTESQINALDFIPIRVRDAAKKRLKDSQAHASANPGIKLAQADLTKWHPNDVILFKDKNIIKQCPKCSIYAEKTVGCNHMTCLSCGHHFCWTCLGPNNQNGCNSGSCRGRPVANNDQIHELPRHPQAAAVAAGQDYLREQRRAQRNNNSRNNNGNINNSGFFSADNFWPCVFIAGVVATFCYVKSKFSKKQSPRYQKYLEKKKEKEAAKK